MTPRVILWVVVTWLCLMHLAGAGLAAQQTIGPQAERYFALMHRRPASEPLFDRFYQAWLGNGTPEELERFLIAQLETQSGAAQHLPLAYFYSRQGRHLEALDRFRQAAESDPLNGELRLFKAQAELDALNVDGAIADLEGLAELETSDTLKARAARLLGKLYLRKGQADKAKLLWQDLLKSRPADEDLYEDLMELQLSEGLYAEALATSDRLLAITRDSYQSVMRRLRKGDILHYAGRSEEALAVYADSLAAVGHASWIEDQILSQCEQVFRRQDNLAGLRTFYRDLIGQAPQRLALKQRLARLLLETNETAEALALFREIVDVTPGDQANQQAYVKALVQAGELEQAIALLTQMTKQFPNNGELLVELAALYERSDQDGQAARALRTYLSRSEETEYAFLRVTRLLERYGQLEQASEVYDRLLDRHADSLTAKEAYAGYLFRIEREVEALALWKTLAQDGDLQMLIRAAQAAALRDHRQEALEWLVSRYQTFSSETSYLSLLCKTAMRLQQYERALPWALRQLALAERFSQIKVAMVQVVTIAERLDRVESMAEALAARPSRSLQDTCLLSELYDSLRMSTEADALLEAVPETQRETALRQRIRLCRLRRDWTAAADLTQTLLDLIGGRDVLAIRDMVDLYRQANDYEAALTWIPRWKQRAPGSVTPWLTEAQLLVSMDRDGEAIRVLRAADQALDGHSDILSQLAQQYAATDQPAEAQRVYWRLFDQSEEVTEKLRWIRDMAAATPTEEGQQRLIERLQERRRGNPRSVIPHLALAEVYRKADRYEDRRQALLEATRIESEDVELLQEIARLETAEGDWTAAIETLKRALPHDDTQSTARKISSLHIRYGHEEEGYRLLAELAGGPQMDRGDAEAIADAMCAGLNWGLAIDFLTGLLDHFPGDYRLHYLYAVALEQEGRDLEATDAFIALLSMTSEIPGHTPQPLASPLASASYNLASLLPEDAQELMTIKWLQQRAYQHKTIRHSASPAYAASSGSAPAVLLPGSIEDLPRFALCHLVTLGQLLDGPERSAFQDRLARHGVRHADVLMDLGGTGFQGLNLAIDTSAERFPRNRAVQAIWMAQRLGSNQPSPKRCKGAYTLFADTHPRLALLAGLKYAAIDGSDPNVLAGTLALLPTLSAPGIFEVRLMISLAQTEAADRDLGAAVRDRLNRQLQTWYPQLSHNSSCRQAMFTHLSQHLLEEDPAGYVRFLDAEITRALSDVNAPGRWMLPRRPGNRGLVEGLSLPLLSVPGVPDRVTRQLMQGLDPRYRAGARSPANDPDALHRHLDQARQEVLKVLLLLAAERLDEADKLLTTLMEAKDPSLATFILAAGIAAERGQYARVVTLLDQARARVRAKGARQRLDGAIVAYALDLNPDSELAGLSLGRQAALRLRSGPLSQAQVVELCDAMEALDLSEEATHLARRLTPTGVAGPIATTAARPQRAIGPTRIQTLFSEGKQEAAQRLLLRDLQAAAANSLYPRMGSSGNRSQEARWLGLLHANGAWDTFIGMADPGEQGSARKLVEYGRVCEILDDQARAQAAYERALDKRPGDVAARVHLAVLLGASDPDRGASILAGLNPHLMNQLGPVLVNVTKRRYRGQQVPEALDIIALMVAYLREGETRARESLDWLDPMLEAIVGPCTGNRVRLPHLYQVSANRGTENPPAAGLSCAALLKRALAAPEGKSGQEPGSEGRVGERRRALHNDLCRAMATRPQVSVTGFSRLAAEALARGELPADLPELAQQAMLSYRPPSTPAGGTTPQSRYNYRRRGQVGPLGPAEFLVIYHHQQGNLDRFAAEFAARLRAGHQAAQARRFERLAALYLATPDAFTRAAEAHLRSLDPQQSSRHTQGRRTDALVWILDVHRERQLDDGIERFLLEQIEEAIKRNPGGQQLFVRHCILLLSDQRPQAAEAFLDGVVTLYVGPAAERAEQVAQHYDRRRVASGSVNARIHHCFGLLRTLAQERDMFFWLTDYVEQMPPLAPQIRAGLEGTLRNLLKESDPNALMTFLDTSPFLADTDGFSTLPMTGIKHNSLYAFLIQQLLQPTGPTHERFRDAIHRQVLARPWTLGTRLLSAHLSDDRDQAVYSALSYAQSAIETAPRRTQQELASMVTDTLGVISEETVGRWHDEAASAHDWMATLRLQRVNEQVTEFLAVQDLHRLQIEDQRLDDYVWEMVERLSATDPRMAKRVLLRGRDLVMRAEKRGQWRHQSSGEFVKQVLAHGAGSQTLGLFALVADLIRDADTRVFLDKATLDRQMNTLQQTYRALQDEQQPDELQVLQRLYERLGRYVGDADMSGLTQCFSPLFQKSRDLKTLDGICAWAREETLRGPYPGVAREINLHAQVSRLGVAAHGGRAASEASRSTIESIGAQLDAVLRDKSLSLYWRLMALDSWLAWDPRVTSGEQMVQGVALLAEAWNDNVPLAETLYGNLLERFIEACGTPAWAESADALTAAHQRQLRRSIGRARPAGGAVSRSTHLALLHINLLRDQEDAIHKLASQRMLANDVDTWALLIAHGKYALARRLMRVPSLEGIKDQTSIAFTTALEEHLPRCLTGVSRPDQRFYFEVRLSTLADGEGDSKPRRTKTERMERLAERFDQIAFRTDTLERETLLILTQTHSTLPALGGALARQAAEIDLGAVCRLSDSRERSLKTRLVLAHAMERLMTGEPDAFLRAIEQVVAARDKQPPNRGSTHDAVLEAMAQRVREMGESLDADWDASKVEGLARVSAQLIASASQPRNTRERAQLSGHCLLYHALAAPDTALDAAYDQVHEQVRNQFVRNENSQALLQILSRLLAHRRTEEKVAIVSRYLALERVQAKLADSADSLITFLTRHEILTEDELVAHGAKLATLAGRERENWQTLADLQEQNRRFDEADTCWLNALNLSEGPTTLWRGAQSYCAFLQRQGRHEQARAYLTALPTETWSDNLKKQHQSRLEKLGNSHSATEATADQGQ